MTVEGLKKHVGTLSNTGVRVAVIFRKLPNDENSCLLVETERLPDSYHDAIIQCLNSREAFETNEFYEVLNRRTFPDGTNCLTSLHQRGFLRKEPVSNVTMFPLPNQPVPLALINATIDGKIEEYKNKETAAQSKVEDTRTQEEKQAAAEALAARMMGINPPIDTADSVSKAKMLISQAELLEADAAKKREEAYELAPDLKPGRGRPPTPEEEKALKLEERKEKRRERDRRKAAEARAAKAEMTIENKIAAKITRDSKRLSQEI